MENITSGVGLRKAVFYETDANLYPSGNQSGADGYAGTDITGVKGVSLNIPDNVRIPHTGDDVVFAQDFLPPTDLPSGTIQTGKMNQILDTILADTLTQTIGEMELDALDTSKAGYEATGILMYYRQALAVEPGDADFGARRWQTFIIPSVRITPQGNSPAQGSDDTNNYSMTPTKVNRTPWGVAFTEMDNGFTAAVRLRLNAEFPVMLERWTGNGTLDTFNTSYAPISVAKTQVWANGTLQTVSSVTDTTIVLSAPVTNNQVIVALYETDSQIS